MDYKQAIKTINDFVKQFSFFELSIYSCSNNKLLIVGSPDSTYYHNIEIEIIDPFFLLSKWNWIVDIKRVIEELNEDEIIEYNKKNKIEIGNKTVKFFDEDGLAFYCSFRHIEIIIKTVKY